MQEWVAYIVAVISGTVDEDLQCVSARWDVHFGLAVGRCDIEGAFDQDIKHPATEVSKKIIESYASRRKVGWKPGVVA